MRDLFEAEEGLSLPIVPGAVLLRAFACDRAPQLLGDLEAVLASSPWRHMTTPGGFLMSVAMTNCGALGWVSDRTGYRYDRIDPANGEPWPAMPESFRALARGASAAAGFEEFEPDACLVNRYEPGARLSLHQDRDERDHAHPIVSVSLGLPAVFLFGGLQRADKSKRLPLAHGDVVVWGGPARLNHHGILPLKEGEHPLTGRCRINLTFRKAG
ncbi:DNA oxidative demethylase AlkB [Variovorax sp. dw_954]|uniref:DNA oxidative demethylase AlkB n=1 Tax=Variovorax sp. dw_954 TaxID=2720078 RepID=UPI001BD6220F|nr:DNA oxidative demethylase AlkB [Variovorax sp. dw_954]